jgi:hypothetical protein
MPIVRLPRDPELVAERADIRLAGVVFQGSLAVAVSESRKVT